MANECAGGPIIPLAGPFFFSGGGDDLVPKETVKNNGSTFSDKGLFLGSINPSAYTTEATTASTIQAVIGSVNGLLYFNAVTEGAAGNTLRVFLFNDQGSPDTEYADVVPGTYVAIQFHLRAASSTMQTILDVIDDTPEVSALISGNFVPFEDPASANLIPLTGFGTYILTNGADATEPTTQQYIQTKLMVGEVFPSSTESAILEMSSATKGFLLPAPNTDNIVGPQHGLMVRDGHRIKVFNAFNQTNLPWRDIAFIDDGATVGAPVSGGSANTLLFAGSDGNLASHDSLKYTLSTRTITLNSDNTSLQFYIKMADSAPNSGELFLLGSDGVTNDTNGGNINITGGSSGAGGGFLAGNVNINGGQGNNGSQDGGHVNIFGGDNVSTGNGGSFEFRAGDGGNDGGPISIIAGDGEWRGGSLSIETGDSNNNHAGHLTLRAGDSAGLDEGGGGSILMQVGSTGPAGMHGALHLGRSNVYYDQYKYGFTTTNDATVTVIETINTVTDRSYRLDLTVVGNRTGGTAGANADSATYHLTARIKNDAGTVTISDLVSETSEDQVAWDATIAVDSLNINVQVTGAVDNDIEWKSVARVTGEFVVLWAS